MKQPKFIPHEFFKNRIKIYYNIVPPYKEVKARTVWACELPVVRTDEFSVGHEICGRGKSAYAAMLDFDKIFMKEEEY
jgi:hypothetical protein